MFDFRLDEVSDWIKGHNVKLVAIQLPEGLKTHARSITAELESRTGASFLILADPCYGACDVPLGFRKYADALVQFGHSEIPGVVKDDRVLFVEVFMDIDVGELLERAVPLLKKRIGLVTTVQHVKMLPDIRSRLEKKGIQVLIGHGDRRIKFEGQVLGCNISSVDHLIDKVDQFLYIGSGDFHPLSIAVETQRQVLVLDPLMQEIRELDQLKDRILRQRHGAITQASSATNFVILVSTKVGQIRLGLAKELKNLAIEKGKSASIVLLEEFDPAYVRSFEADVYVSTACPRIAIDDYLRYPRPILTPMEMEIALGVKDWSEYRMDRIIEEDHQGED